MSKWYINTLLSFTKSVLSEPLQDHGKVFSGMKFSKSVFMKPFFMTKTETLKKHVNGDEYVKC